ncbi:spore germination protein [Paenibacillus nanensis]|uniref:Spore germination protein n=2 Tax=Paenibacillus nanensis TaxID=393251 RepID=A0A3A1UP66_9BACL|nr:spore germination protein [Paenibacillus nanensis]
MKRFWRELHPKRGQDASGSDTDSLKMLREEKEPLSVKLEDNKSRLEHIFTGCSDIVFRPIKLNADTDALIVYTEGIVESQLINDHVLHPLMHYFQAKDMSAEPKTLDQAWISLSQAELTSQLGDVVYAVLTSSAVVLIEGYAQAAMYSVKGGTRRGVEEPTTEAVVRGPREGFTENLRVNTALLRFKIKSPDLKTVSFTKGERTQTSIVLSYIDGIIDPKIVEEVTKRLEAIQIDAVLESGYIEELIEDSPYSPFPQMQYSERPDTIAAQLLEGRFAIFVDGTPFVLVAPITLWQMLQASEDYYERYYISNLLRWLRIVFLFLALFLPGLYIAVITFHQDMLPTTLILSIAAARESIPFPALVEVLIMELSFEALREAGIRLPKTVGQAVSILGALVIGQAAVEAGIVSAPMVIIVAVTGVASFTIPRFNLAISVRLLRFPIFIMAALFGLFGMIIASVWILAHLCHLRSFGVPYLSGVTPYSKDDQKDIFIRQPWWRMVLRPDSISSKGRNGRRRMNARVKPKDPKESW